MPHQTTAAVSQPATPALVVLGLDDKGKAHASWFNEADAALATKAAGLMGMTALKVATDEIRALATQLPPGRVFASGRTFVPFVKAKLFDALSQHAPAAAIAAPAGGEGKDVGNAGAIVQEGGQQPPKLETPQRVDWSTIGPGHVVLASEAADDGWWECIVVKKLSDRMFELRWKDWPELDSFIRRPEHLGLLHPDYSKAG